MTVLKKVKQDKDVEYLELDKSTREPDQYVSNDLKIHTSDTECEERHQEIADERAPVEPGVYKKRTFITERNK
ncbi:MAG: hypothetical protein Q8O88_01355 [bacterium]|nr:hypothetical protein [bacterium]